MRSTVVLLVGCLVMLLGAYFASRLLVSDVPAQVNTAAAPKIVEPVTLSPLPSDTPARRLAPEAVIRDPSSGSIAPVAPRVPTSYPRLAEGNSPTPEVAESPFQGDSKELDYAEALLAEPEPSLERLVSAHAVLSRCVEQEPNNKRCQNALSIALTRLGGRVGTDRKPDSPTLKAEPPHLQRPASGPK